MTPLEECEDALNKLYAARSAMGPDEKAYREGEVAFAVATVQGAIVLAIAHITECKRQWKMVMT